MGMTMAHRPRILFVDAYDSFTNNIIALFETTLHVHLTIIHIDTPIDSLEQFLEPFFAVILGPGPGNPHNLEDVGLYRRFWQLSGDAVLPIFGVCLGFQSLVLAFGGTICQLPQPRHGLVRTVRAAGESDSNLFNGQLETVQYHSLYAQLETSFTPSSDLIPLAWDHAADNHVLDHSYYDQNPPSILMAVRHRHLPYYGIQFHPESACSSITAQNIISNWWEQILAWRSLYPKPIISTRQSRTADDHLQAPSASAAKSINTGKQDAYGSVLSKVIPQCDLTIQNICSKLRLTGSEVIVLDSENHQRPVIGQFSVVGIVSPDALFFEYRSGSRFVRQVRDRSRSDIDLNEGYKGDIFNFLKAFMSQQHVTQGPESIPFWGGLIGCISYEGCLEALSTPSLPLTKSPSSGGGPPDISFVFVERSIVLSHFTKEVYVQSLKIEDWAWLNSVAYILSNTPPPSLAIQTSLKLNARITLPKKARYKSAIRSCQQFIRSGDSYELCLTNRVTITTDKVPDPWPLYLRLREVNPAPFAAYYRAGGLTLVSSSPERFLSWSRPQDGVSSEHLQSTCQFRPIKGTIKRKPDPGGPPLTLAQATKMLATPKERAENLMIVDLIRHDLHGVAGSGNVMVPKLMVVEEYETVFQLVSVIEGTLQIPKALPKPDQCGSDSAGASSCISAQPSGIAQNGVTAETAPKRSKAGIDVLGASLPPGSMTGAPKLRSCQLLQSLEGQPRGIYSGVFGYLDVGGGGDFSVVIRSAFKWDGNHRTGRRAEEEYHGQYASEGEKRDTWTIGAGGAITALSTEEGEYEEMMAKLRSTLSLFEDETTTYG